MAGQAGSGGEEKVTTKARSVRIFSFRLRALRVFVVEFLIGRPTQSRCGIGIRYCAKTIFRGFVARRVSFPNSAVPLRRLSWAIRSGESRHRWAWDRRRARH